MFGCIICTLINRIGTFVSDVGTNVVIQQHRLGIVVHGLDLFDIMISFHVIPSKNSLIFSSIDGKITHTSFTENEMNVLKKGES